MQDAAAHATPRRSASAHGAAIQIRVGLNSGEVDRPADLATTCTWTTPRWARRSTWPRGWSSSRAPGTAAAHARHAGAGRRARRGRGRSGRCRSRGSTEPVEVFELVGAGAARTRLQASAARGLTPLRRAAMRAGGDPARRSSAPAPARARSWRWSASPAWASRGWSTRSPSAAPSPAGWCSRRGAISYGTSTAYLPIIDLLKGTSGSRPATIAEAMREQRHRPPAGARPGAGAARLAAAGPARCAGRGRGLGGLDPPRRRRATLDAVKRLLLRESQEQPLLLVFEDLHWIDSETPGAARRAWSTRCRPLGILLLVNYRPEYSHAWGNKSALHPAPGRPAGDRRAPMRCCGAARRDAGPRAAQALLIEQTEGNPLFLEECVRTWSRPGRWSGERGGYA